MSRPSLSVLILVVREGEIGALQHEELLPADTRIPSTALKVVNYPIRLGLS